MKRAITRFGSIGTWLLMRFFQIIFICIDVFLLIGLGANPRQWQLLLAIVFLTLCLFYSDSFVYGFADDDGVHYRRYFKMQFKSWDQFQRISWAGANVLSLHLKKGVLFRKELNVNSATSILIDPHAEPELVRWIQVAKPSAADGIELVPWGDTTDISNRAKITFRAGALISFIAIVIWCVVALVR